MPERENLLRSLFSKKVLSNKRRIHVFIDFLEDILFIYLIVDVGIVGGTHVEIHREGSREELIIYKVLLVPLLHRIQMKTLDAYFLFHGWKVEHFEVSFLEQNYHFVGGGMMTGLEF